ncbi:MAG TPA: type II toxin-antitoxin system ParD family antitoxin [Allosphingosinicella sp.]|jgi:antitoxin ParD1/3/4
MATRANRPVSITLGPLAAAAEERVKQGRYASISEVVRAGLRALEREEAEFDAILKRKVEEALADPRPDIPGEEVEEFLRSLHEQRLRGA